MSSRPVLEGPPLTPEGGVSGGFALRRIFGEEPTAVTAARVALPVILLVFVLIFSLARPETFFTVSNLKTILSTQSVLGILAIATILPPIIGEFDLSVGANLGFGAILVTGLTSKQGLGVVPAILVAIAACTVVGAFNGLLVAKIGINSLVTTLGSQFVLLGIIIWYTGGNVFYTGIPKGLTNIGQKSAIGIPLPVFYLAGAAIVVWYLLEYTPLGRYLYAIGGSKDAARLSGLNVQGLTLFAFALTGLLCGVAGVIESAELGSGNPNVGPPFLLPAFAAAFLGATAIKPGTYNVLGTIFGVFALETGITGLEQVGIDPYVEYLFTGFALILAVAAARFLRREAL
jgi:ribose transport system permease protein